jgi:hypothetical protein
MMIYYKDVCSGGGDGVARAKLSDVIAAAKAGHVTSWSKYYNGAWNSSGIGGQCSSMNIEYGIDHTDAAYSTYTGKYYLVLTHQNDGGADTWVRLYESTDGLNWTRAATIADQPASSVDIGYQYVTIVDASGSDNGVVGQKFYVYSAKDPVGFNNTATVYRWLVDLNGTDSPSLTQSSFTASSDYTSSSDAAGAWSYFYNTGTALLPMKWEVAPWDANLFVWTGGETYALIGKGWMHPGASEDVLLIWTAPRSGTVNVNGKVAKGEISCGDGVVATVSHGLTQQWQSNVLWQKTIAFNDNIGSSFALTVPVSTGDTIYFTLNKGASTNDCDATNFDPTITYIQ